MQVDGTGRTYFPSQATTLTIPATAPVLEIISIPLADNYSPPNTNTNTKEQSSAIVQLVSVGMNLSNHSPVSTPVLNTAKTT